MNARVQSLDGIRGMAIALVLLLHLYDKPRNGWVGVDLFFVLSGYLITTILLRERHERFFWQIFYTRRVTRILPAYALLVLAAALWTPLHLREIWAYLAFFGANFAYLKVSYSGVGVLVVLWSLAVEEHFYFLWPVNVRAFQTPTLIGILTAVIVAEPLIRVACLSFIHDFFIFYTLTPFRLDGIAMGSLLALLLAQERSRALLERWLPLLLGGACLVFGVTLGLLHLTRENDMLFMNGLGYTIIDGTFMLLVAWLVLRPMGWLAKMFSFAPLTFLGRISYGLYLYQLLIQYWCEAAAKRMGYGHHFVVETAALLLSILAAWVSFHLFESRFLEYGRQRVRGYRLREAAMPLTKSGKI